MSRLKDRKKSFFCDYLDCDQKQSVFHVISPVELVLLLPVQVQPFHGIADGGFEESQLYYTTPQAKKQAENAGNAKEIIDRSTADFLPGACRTGGGEGEVVFHSVADGGF